MYIWERDTGNHEGRLFTLCYKLVANNGWINLHSEFLHSNVSFV